MAKELTPRQQQIHDLLEEGKSPPQIAKKLRITTNAVYQQIRRMRNSGGSSRSRSRTSGRKSGGSSRRATRTSTPARPAAAPKPMTAEELIRSEIESNEGEIAAKNTEIEQAKALIESLTGEIGQLTEDNARKADVLAVLTGEKVAHAKPQPKPAAKPASRGKQATGQKASGDGAKPASAPQEPPQAPQNGDGGSGEESAEQAEAEQAQQAAEAPQEPQAPAAA
jgi:hypothetical protein